MDHELFEHQLGNGSRALVIHVPGAKVAGARAYFRSGNAFTDNSKFEIPHLAEHMMGTGNQLYPSALEFKVEVERNGAYRNAHTGPYFNDYEYICAQYEFERIMELLAVQISQPLFPAKSFEAEKGNVREELLRNTSDYRRQAGQLVRGLTSSNSNKGDEERIDQLPAITLEDLEGHYQRTHTRANLRLMIVGDFADQGQELLERFERNMSKMPPGKRLEVPKEPEWQADGPLIDPRPIKQIYYAFHILTKQPLSYEEQVKAEVLRRMFRGRYDSWFYGEARERGLAYELQVLLWTTPLTTELRTEAHVSRDNATELFKIFSKSWGRAIEGDFGEQDVDDAKAFAHGLYTRLFDSPVELLDWYGQTYAICDQLQPLDEYLEKLKKISKQDVVQAANLLTSERRWALGLVGNIDKDLAQELHDILRPIFI